MFFFVLGDENGSIAATMPDKPVPLKNFIKVCDQRRKFPVLFKLEFQVIIFTTYRLMIKMMMFNKSVLLYGQVTIYYIYSAYFGQRVLLYHNRSLSFSGVSFNFLSLDLEDYCPRS